MAGGADHKGFASPVRHCLGPLGLERSGYAEVGQLANVVDLHVVRLLAYLARIREESGDELLLRIVDPDRLTVSDRRDFCRWSGIPPNRATSGCLPLRSTRASKQVRSPCGVWILALCLTAIFDTDERCLPARVLSIEVSMTQRSRCSR